MARIPLIVRAKAYWRVRKQARQESKLLKQEEKNQQASSRGKVRVQKALKSPVKRLTKLNLGEYDVPFFQRVNRGKTVRMPNGKTFTITKFIPLKKFQQLQLLCRGRPALARRIHDMLAFELEGGANEMGPEFKRRVYNPNDPDPPVRIKDGQGLEIDPENPRRVLKRMRSSEIVKNPNHQYYIKAVGVEVSRFPFPRFLPFSEALSQLEKDAGKTIEINGNKIRASPRAEKNFRNTAYRLAVKEIMAERARKGQRLPVKERDRTEAAIKNLNQMAAQFKQMIGKLPESLARPETQEEQAQQQARKKQAQ